ADSSTDPCTLLHPDDLEGLRFTDGVRADPPSLDDARLFTSNRSVRDVCWYETLSSGGLSEALTFEVTESPEPLSVDRFDGTVHAVHDIGESSVLRTNDNSKELIAQQDGVRYSHSASLQVFDDARL